VFERLWESDGSGRIGGSAAWAQEGGRERLLERLTIPAERVRIKRDFAEGIPGWEDLAGAGGWDKVRISSVDRHAAYLGKTIQQVADEHTSSSTASSPSATVSTPVLGPARCSALADAGDRFRSGRRPSVPGPWMHLRRRGGQPRRGSRPRPGRPVMSGPLGALVPAPSSGSSRREGAARPSIES